MANGNVKLFRSQMGGFNREDVNNYIKEADLKHAAELDALKAQIDSIKTEIANLSKKCASLEEDKTAAEERAKVAEDAINEKNLQIADISKKLDFYKTESEAQINVMNNLKIENKRLAAELESSAPKSDSSLAEEIARLTSLSAEKDSIIVSLNDEIERVNAENIALLENTQLGDINDKSSAAYKLDMYNKISTQLGDILINANRSADDIVSSAREKADVLLAEAESECQKKKEEADAQAEYVRARIADITGEVIDSVSGELHGNIENCMKEISTCIDDMQYEIKTVMTKLSSRSLEMNDKVAYYQNSANESVDKKLSEMDAEYSTVFAESEADNV